MYFSITDTPWRRTWVNITVSTLTVSFCKGKVELIVITQDYHQNCSVFVQYLLKINKL